MQHTEPSRQNIVVAIRDINAKFSRLTRQRAALLEEVQQLLAWGQAMLAELGGTPQPAVPTRRSVPGRRGRRSPETRAKLREAWKRRKAAALARGQAGVVSAETRARIAAAQRKRWAKLKRDGKRTTA